ncbi:hypothetical protein ACOBR2_03320 [Telmatobacter bradus]|uniref:hypothetical protein n=1 Tax=Telmatobacter bradus TaxID=474953 RepID=UPI003B439825
MKSVIYSLMAAFLLSTPLWAQTPTSGCGDVATQYTTSHDPGLHPAPTAKGQVRIFYIEDDDVKGFIKPTMRIGLDGQWVGAAEGRSYFFIYVNPGPHKLCINWQNPDLFIHKQKPPQAELEFTAKEGETYYFIGEGDFHGVGRTSITLDPMKTAEGEETIEDYPLSIFHTGQ